VIGGPTADVNRGKQSGGAWPGCHGDAPAAL